MRPGIPRIGRKLVRQADGRYAWSVAYGRRLIASGIAADQDVAMAEIETATRRCFEAARARPEGT